MNRALLILSILLFNASIFTLAICYHDNNIMLDKIEQMERAQAKQAAEIRQIKTDTETALRVVITGDFMEIEK